MISRWPVLIGIPLLSFSTAAGAQTMTAEEAAALTTDANARTADANARTAEATADKTEAESKAAVAKAKLGALADLNSESSTTATNNAGTIEATVLGMGEARVAARQIVRGLCGSSAKAALCNARASAAGAQPIAVDACSDLTNVAPSPAKLYIYSETQPPIFDAAETVQAALCGIETKLKGAMATSGGLTQTGGPLAILSLAATAAKLFRTDYAISGLSVGTDDLLLAKQVLSEAKAAAPDGIKSIITAPIYIPALYRNAALSKDSPLMAAVLNLKTLRDQAADLAETHRGEAKRLAKNKKAAKVHADKAAAIDAAIKAHDDYLAKITTVSEKGIAELSEAARQSQIRQDLASGSYLLTVKMNAAGGSGYTKKNFWTMIGGPAFFVSGGAEASYTLFNGATGEAVSAGEFGSVSPFKRIGQVRR